MDNFYQEAIDLKISYSWDNKEWSRRTGIRQDILAAVSSGEMPEDRELLNAILKETKLGKRKDTSSLKRFVRPNIIAVSLHKGGGGKTTVTLNLAGSLAAMGYNVLVIDSDSQMDATSNLLGTRDNQDQNLFNAISAGTDIRTQILQTPYPRLDLVPSSIRMASMESRISVQAHEGADALSLFRTCTEQLVAENYYDFVFVDMDKTIGKLNETILNGCTHLLMVAECAVFHVKGIGVMSTQYDRVKSAGNPDLKLLGVILNKVPSKKEIVRIVNDVLDSLQPGLRFRAYIREDDNVVESQWNQVLLSEQNRRCRASRDIEKVKKEFLTRIDTVRADRNGIMEQMQNRFASPTGIYI